MTVSPMNFARIAPIVLSLLLVVSGFGARAADGPAVLVTRLNEALVSAMKEAESLGYAGRHQRLAPVIEGTFNLAFMARAAAGRHWRDMSGDERQRYALAFAELSIATHAARFDGWSGERFELGEAVDHPRGGVVQRNRLLRPDDAPVAIDYLLREFEGEWRIVDVFLDGGISEIATKRSEYGSVLARDGVEGLIAALRAKIAEMAAEE
jgi:phospholipid transport system substrate-binding protein